MAFTGKRVRELRERWGMRQAEWAALVGTSSPTVYRWEASPDVRLRISPHEHRVLSVLENLTTSAPPEALDELAARVHQALMLHGALRGLYVLLNELYAGEPSLKLVAASVRRVASDPS